MKRVPRTRGISLKDRTSPTRPVRDVGCRLAGPPNMRRQGVLTVAVMTLFMVCAFVESTRAQTRTLSWTGDGLSNNIGGYRVVIDGVTTDHGTTPLQAERHVRMLDPAVPQRRAAHDRGDGLQRIRSDAVGAVCRRTERESRRSVLGTEPGRYRRKRSGLDRANGNAHQLPWQWGDGTANTSSAAPSASHTYSTAGTFTVTLTVTDNAGATASATTTATISATSTLPAPWQTQDVGSRRPGRQRVVLGRPVHGGGRGRRHLGYGRRVPLRVSIAVGRRADRRARGTSVQNTHACAKAGVMIRESLNANAHSCAR